MKELRVLMNTRALANELTGVQRYALELLDQWNGRVETVSPPGSLQGLRGHAWEQFVLPFRLHGKLLFSPCNVGPIGVARQVVTIHDIAPLDHPEWSNPRFSAWYRWLIPRLVHNARSVIAASEFTRQRIIEVAGAAPEKVIAIHNGVNRNFRPATIEQIDQVRHELKLPEKYILSLGSLEPRKNLPRLLQAWGSVLRHLPEDISLVIAGARGDSSIFRDVALRSTPRVLFSGRVPDTLLAPLYSGALGFVYLSLYEGFGLPPLEAMACGCPVAVSNTTSLPEVVGNAGLTVDPLDIDAIETTILQLATDAELRARLTITGRQRAETFHWSTTARKTWDVLMAANEGR